METMNPLVDQYLTRAKKWREEMEKLRMIILNCGLDEELKWSAPCYTYRKSNIVIIQGFKEYCAVLFFKGALLCDADRVLAKPGELTQAGRQIRFSSVKEILEIEDTIRAYIFEAIEVERAGLKVKMKRVSEMVIPEEFQSMLDGIPLLREAFNRLTPGRQRAYILYFSGARQSKTRVSRIERFIPHILKGKGINDL